MPPDPEPPPDGPPGPGPGFTPGGDRRGNGHGAFGRPGPPAPPVVPPGGAGFAAHRGAALGGGSAFGPVDDGGSFGTDADDVGEDEGGRRHRPRWVRVVGLVIVAALVLGSVSTGVGIILGGGSGVSGPAVPSEVVAVGPAPGQRTGTNLEEVTFSVGNITGNPLTPVCSVAVVRAGTTLGVVTARAARPLAAGERISAALSVPISRPVFAGTPADARVSCTG